MKLTAEKLFIAIVDVHSSRFSKKCLRECMLKHIIIFIGVPNATHIYQTCDDQVFLQYKNKPRQNKRFWKKQHTYHTFKMHNEIEMNLKSMKQMMKQTKKYTESACKHCGILPFNPEKLQRLSAKTCEVANDPHDPNATNANPPNKPKPHKAKPNACFRNGGIATDSKFIKYLENKC